MRIYKNYFISMAGGNNNNINFSNGNIRIVLGTGSFIKTIHSVAKETETWESHGAIMNYKFSGFSIGR